MSIAPTEPRTRLRTLIATVEREIDLTTAAAPVRAAFAELVAAMALGPEPEMRLCPACKGPCRVNAQRCGLCWQPLPLMPEAAAAPTAATS